MTMKSAHDSAAQPAPVTPLSRAMDTIRNLRRELEAQRSGESVAVVGIGLRLPGGIDDLDSYWDALAGGKNLVHPLTEARKGPFAADWRDLPQRGGFLDEVMDFDAEFFGLSSREARNLDPQHRLLLEVAWEALENAALPPDRLRSSRTGFFTGITGLDYQDWQTREPDTSWAVGNGHCFAAGRVSYTLGLTGPAMAVDTACSSSLVTVHLARQALERGECDIALAGGVNLILSPRSTRLIEQTGLLAPDGHCKPFDARANGFTRGEGCGIVVLKRLSDALRSNDHVHAVIRGSAVNHDGRSTGITAPSVLSQIDLLKAAVRDAGLEPSDIGMVEAHGTGTALGDPIEMEAIVSALGRRNGGARLLVGAVKANLGHLEAAAGIAGLIKAILCLRHRTVPPLVHFTALNPRIDIGDTGIVLPAKREQWGPDGTGTCAGVSSFGMSGTNAHVIVGPLTAQEESRRAPAEQAPVGGFELAARSPEALRTLAARFSERLAALPAESYPAFAYTASRGRARHELRAVVSAASHDAALDALHALATGADSPAVTLRSGEQAGPGAEDGIPPRAVIELPHYPWQRRRHALDPSVASPL